MDEKCNDLVLRNLLMIVGVLPVANRYHFTWSIAYISNASSLAYAGPHPRLIYFDHITDVMA